VDVKVSAIESSNDNISLLLIGYCI